MTKNMGTVDRVIRTIVAIAIGILILTSRIGGALAIVLGIVAAVFLVTSLLAHCPAYLPLRLSTRKERPGSPGV